MNIFLSPRELVEKYPSIATSTSALKMRRSRREGLPFYRFGKNRIFYKASDIADELERNRVCTRNGKEVKKILYSKEIFPQLWDLLRE